MPKIFVDNQPHEFEGEGRCLLDVLLSLGFDVPYFCWHPALQSVGACRQCAVKLFKDESDKAGKIVMSCMTEAADGLRVSVDDPEVRAFRARVIEWLMLNHPHDCPICDEGGECHLQDMTVMTGHAYRRTRFRKRTYRNQDLGPFVNHEMNRCIQCYRCVRFYRDVAGGRDLDVFGWHDHVYFGRHADGRLESGFSGNLVEICPTGVFTDKTLKQHYTRKWDLQTAPSVCVHCGLGCNTIAGSHTGMLRRIRSRFHSEVNGYFLCDRGRFGYGFVNSPQRIRQPMVRDIDGELDAVPADQALSRVAELLRGGRAIGVGSPRASLEANFALRRLVGAENFFAAIPDTELHLLRRMVELLRAGPAPVAGMGDVRRADAALVLGEDCHNAAPMLAMALRQTAFNQPLADALNRDIPAWHDRALRESIQDDRGPVFVVTPDATSLDADAAATLRASPDDIARLGAAVAHELDRSAPAPAGLAREAADLAGRIARALRQADAPVVVAGMSCLSMPVLDAAGNVAAALHHAGKDTAKLCLTTPRCNDLALPLLEAGESSAALDAVASGSADTLIVLEADLPRTLGRTRAGQLLAKARQVVVLDHLMTETASAADVLLPAATFAEATGTLINHEARAQRSFQVMVPQGQVRPAWRWLTEARAGADGQEPAPAREDDVLAAVADAVGELAPAVRAAPPADHRVGGQIVPRQTHRHSGRTAVHADVTVHEPAPPADPDAPLAFSMEGYPCQPDSAALIPRFWAPGWNSVQAVDQYQTQVGGPLRGGPAGIRLIAPGPGGRDYATPPDEPPAGEAGTWLALPRWQTFGSDELSARAPAIAELAGGPTVAVNARAARRLDAADGQEVLVEANGASVRATLTVRPALPDGIALLSAGAAAEIGPLPRRVGIQTEGPTP